MHAESLAKTLTVMFIQDANCPGVVFNNCPEDKDTWCAIGAPGATIVSTFGKFKRYIYVKQSWITHAARSNLIPVGDQLIPTYPDVAHEQIQSDEVLLCDGTNIPTIIQEATA